VVAVAQTGLVGRAEGIGARGVRESPLRLVLLAVIAAGLVAAALASSQWASPPARPLVAAHRHFEGLGALPATARSPISDRLGSDSPAYLVTHTGAGLAITNPRQRLHASFSANGVEIASGTTHLGLDLRAAAYGDVPARLAKTDPRASANRVEYAYRGPASLGLSAWYANGPLGLDQGFTIPHAPARSASPVLTLALALSGDVKATLGPDAHSALLKAQGGPSLRYGALSAVDARGHELRSWMELRRGQILLHVDTRGASYPVRVDPLVQQGEKLSGGEEVGQGDFGYTVALSADGNTALIGGVGDDGNLGAAWVFTRSGSVWTQQGPKLTGAGEHEELFGLSVALSADGNTALIGAEGAGERNGAAYVFTRVGGGWSQQGERLTPLTAGRYGEFGWEVALSADGNTALIGAYTENKGVGAAYVFVRSGETWTQQGPALTGAGESGYGCFGSVALSADGNTAAVGGLCDNNDRGAAWIFTRSGETWTQQGPKLTGSGEGGSETFFGFSLALSADGDTVLIGGYGNDGYAGAAWVFTRSGESWSQQGEKLTPTGEGEGATFGFRVALTSDGNTALISGVNSGGVWVFARSGETWSQQERLMGGGGPAFGSGVAISANGETALVGADGSDESSGAAWAFINEPPVPPTVTTGAASSITQTSATLGGSVNPNSLPTSCRFEYGPSEEYGHSAPCTSSPGNGGSVVEVSAHVEGLEADTTYHYRLVAHNQGGYSYGADQTFETLPNAPAIITGPATAVMPHSASLTGTVDPEGGAIKSCGFEYGTTTEYGATASCSSLPGAVHTPVAVSASISGLQENTTYHFRLIAGNAGGTSYGGDEKFTTAGPPDLGRCEPAPSDGGAAARAHFAISRATYSGTFTNASCVKTSATHTGRYEWTPGVARSGFTTSLEKGTVALETAGRVKVTCTSERGGGEYGGVKEVVDVSFAFSGCESSGRSCTTPGLGSGEIDSHTLEGELGWEARSRRKVALDLYPAGRTGAFLEYRCTAGVPITVEGSLLVPVRTDKMLTASMLKYKARKGQQRPSGFEGGASDVLSASLNGEATEQMGLSATLALQSEEGVEVNAGY
jgi:hypothetical protein